jgi:gas vesicle protein
MKNSMGTGKVIGGILIGTLFGVALRMLFASPCRCKTNSNHASGPIDIAKDLRKKMKEEADAMRSKAEELESLASE